MLTLSVGLSLQTRRGSKADPVTEDDVLRAIDKLQVLGGGFGVVRVGDRRLVRSVPGELNTDKNQALLLAQGRGHISKRQLTEVTHSCLQKHSELPSCAEFISAHTMYIGILAEPCYMPKEQMAV